MSETAEELKPLLRSLSDTDRLELMIFLHSLEKVDDETLTEDEWESAWIQECEKRQADLAAGRTELVPAEEVMARLQARFG